MTVTRVPDLADVLRKAGLNVIEESYEYGPYAGKTWKDVGFGSNEWTDMRFVLWHHDASPQGDSPGACDWMKHMEIAPAGNAWVCGGCNGEHVPGTWHLIAGRYSNHAGTGGPGWGVPKDGMNAYAFGIETDHTLGESWKPEEKQQQLAGLRLGTAALMKHYGLTPKPGLLFHKTWTDGGVDGLPWFVTRGRKNDIDGLDLASERKAVQALMDSIGRQLPVVRLSKAVPGTRSVDVRIIREALVAQGLLVSSTARLTYFGQRMQDAYAAWQRKKKFTEETPGVPGVASLTALGAKHGFTVSES